MDASPAWERRSVETARKRRVELRGSMLLLERALAAPAPGRASQWADAVGESLRRLQADFGQHISVTEGPEGLYQDILGSAPRLAHAIAQLLREHADMCAALENLVRDVSGVDDDTDRARRLRERANTLLGQLVRHRQRGADLVFEAYETDIGGET